jgi:hypothetical protein
MPTLETLFKKTKSAQTQAISNARTGPKSPAGDSA